MCNLSHYHSSIPTRCDGSSLAVPFRCVWGDTEDKDCPEKVVGHSLPDGPHTGTPAPTGAQIG